MGILLEKVQEQVKKSRGTLEFFTQNSIYFTNKYTKSDKEVQSIPITGITSGRFYFFHYLDDSKWVSYSPVFSIDFKKFENLIIYRAINLNFIPLEERVSIFDEYILKEDMKNDRNLAVDYEEIYTKLRSYGFEYAIMEYNLAQLKFCHRINMDSVSRFLYSTHTINKYDEKKLRSIRETKMQTSDKRHREMSQATIKDFYNISEEIDENFEVLKKHIQRIQTSLNKYGR